MANDPSYNSEPGQVLRRLVTRATGYAVVTDEQGPPLELDHAQRVIRVRADLDPDRFGLLLQRATACLVGEQGGRR